MLEWGKPVYWGLGLNQLFSIDDLLDLNFLTNCCIEDSEFHIKEGTKRIQKQYGKEMLLSVPLTEIIIQLKFINV